MKPGRAEFVAGSRLAVVGVSRTKGFANLVLRELKAGGYTVFPVNADADEVEGERCYRRLDDVPGPLDGVVVVVKPERAEEVVADCARLGIQRVWLQQGAASPAALARAAAAGITVVHQACILMYATPHGVHKFHRGLARLFGRL